MNTRTFLSTLAVPATLSTALIVVATLNPIFLSWNNLVNIVLQASIIGVISLGMTLVIITRGIDLSVGAVVALSGIVLAQAGAAGMTASGAVFCALVVGLMCGVINGTVVAAFGVPSFIATLGMMGIARGSALLLSDGRPLSDIGWISSSLGSGSVAGVPSLIVFFVSVAALIHVLLRSSIWGVRLYAIGGNPKAAWIAGVNVGRYTLGIYGLCGFLAGLAGIAVAGRLGSAQPLAGTLYELDAITAAVLGGATLAGGRGSALGAAAGAILLSAIRNAMVLTNLSPYYHQIVIGIVLVAVLLADSIRRSSKDALDNKD